MSDAAGQAETSAPTAGAGEAEATAEAPDSATATATATEAPPAAAPPASDAEATTGAPPRPTGPDVDLSKLAAPYVDEAQGIASPEAALEGALLILADRIAHDPVTRARYRDELRRGILRAKPVNPDGDAGRYQEFFNFAEPIVRIPSGRMLALRRAEREKILKLELTLPEGRHRELLRELHASDTSEGTSIGDFYSLVFDRAAEQLQDLCGKDVRRRLKEKADREAMRTYSRNLRSQLLAPPLGFKEGAVATHQREGNVGGAAGRGRLGRRAQNAANRQR